MSEISIQSYFSSFDPVESNNFKSSEVIEAEYVNDFTCDFTEQQTSSYCSSNNEPFYEMGHNNLRSCIDESFMQFNCDQLLSNENHPRTSNLNFDDNSCVKQMTINELSLTENNESHSNQHTFVENNSSITNPTFDDNSSMVSLSS